MAKEQPIEIFMPPNVLKAKVGGTGVLDLGAIKRAEAAIDTRVCECCPTDVAVTSEGAVAVYRNRSASDVRDIYVTRRVAGRGEYLFVLN